MPINPYIAQGLPDLGAGARQAYQQNIDNQRQNALLDMNQQRFDMERQRYDAEQQQRLAAMQEKDAEDRKAMLMGRYLNGDKSVVPAIFQAEGFDPSELQGTQFDVDGWIKWRAQMLGVIPDANKSDRLYEYVDQGGSPKYGFASDAVGKQPYVKPSASDKPSNVQEYEYLTSLSPEQQRVYLETKRANANPGVIYDNTRAKREGEADAEFVNNWPKVRRGYEASINGFDRTLGSIRKVRANVNGWTVGFMSNIGKFKAGTPQYDLQRRLEPVLAAIGFDKLQNMRENSPTGGALGQVSERELTYLQSTIASLDTAQSPEQFADALDAVEKAYIQYKQATQKAIKEDESRYNRLKVRGGIKPMDAASPVENDPLGLRQ